MNCEIWSYEVKFAGIKSRIMAQNFAGLQGTMKTTKFLDPQNFRTMISEKISEVRN